MNLPLFLGLAGLLGAASAGSMPHWRFKGRSASPGASPHGQGGGLEKRQRSAYPPNTLDVPIDHFPNKDRYLPHTNGTFKQHYYFDATYYRPGGPVFLYIGGETDARGRFPVMQTGIVQILMNATGGLGVILENRYYGQSYPFASSTTDELVYLSNEQTIADIAHFAQHAVFPGVGNDTANMTGPGSLVAPATPWILYGGSLAGGQTAMAVKTYGDILYGGIAASGIIHVQLEYPQWYAPIQKYGPPDCAATINDIIDNFDGLVAAGNTAAIDEFKALFGLQSIVDIRDFAATIAFPLGGPLFYPGESWQELIWNDPYTDFWAFCSNVTNLDAPSSVVQADYTMAKYTGGKPWTGLGNWAQYVKQAVLPVCPNGDYNSNDCFGTQNQSYWAMTSNNGGRSYMYTACTEGGLYQAAPKTGRSLISRVLDANYTQEWCVWSFPPGATNSIPATPDLALWNVYGDFDLRADRLAFVDGSIDPWLDATYHSNLVPASDPGDDPASASQDYSTTLNPELLIPGAGHHWDSTGIPDVPAEPQFIREAHLWEVRTVRRWLKGFAAWRRGGSC